MKRTLLIIVLVLLTSTWACAETSMWKAQKGDSVIFLGGTCHVLRSTDYPLPQEFEKAYYASQVLVLETDMGKVHDPAFQQKFLQKAKYADGTTLDKHISPQTYAALQAFCKENNIPLAVLKPYRASMAMVTLTVIELMKLGISQQGVDQFFYDMAQRDNKAIEQFETVDEQMDAILSLADGNEDEFVKYSMRDLKTLENKFGDLADAWRNGDAAKLDALLLGEMKSQAPKQYKKLIVDRNRNWLPVIASYEKKPKTRMILVGVGHLVGPDGLIEALRTMGYRVTQM